MLGMKLSRVVTFLFRPIVCPINNAPIDRLSKMEAIVTTTITKIAASYS